MSTEKPVRIQDLKKTLALAAVLCLAGLGSGYFSHPEVFFKSYLLGWLFAASFGIGSLVLVMLHNLTGGAWGFAMRPYVTAMTRVIPLVTLLFIPIAFGLPHIYEWADAARVAEDAVLQEKSLYLNAHFFLGRTAFYLAVWNVLAHLLNRWMTALDSTHDPKYAARLQAVSGLGLVLLGLTGTFAAFDWVMSLEPHWYSTIFGLMYIVGCTLSALSLSVILAALSSRKHMDPKTEIAHFHDFGNLMLAFVMLWTYMAFSQFLIIWSANLPEETVYFIKRQTGGWQYIGVTLLLLHFAVPFFLLLMRAVKRNVRALACVAAWLLVMRLLDLIWLVNPVFGEHVFVHWLDMLSVGGFSMAVLSVVFFGLSGPSEPVHAPAGREAH